MVVVALLQQGMCTRSKCASRSAAMRSNLIPGKKTSQRRQQRQLSSMVTEVAAEDVANGGDQTKRERAQSAHESAKRQIATCEQESLYKNIGRSDNSTTGFSRVTHHTRGQKYDSQTVGRNRGPCFSYKYYMPGGERRFFYGAEGLRDALEEYLIENPAARVKVCSPARMKIPKGRGCRVHFAPQIQYLSPSPGCIEHVAQMAEWTEGHIKRERNAREESERPQGRQARSFQGVKLSTYTIASIAA